MKPISAKAIEQLIRKGILFRDVVGDSPTEVVYWVDGLTGRKYIYRRLKDNPNYYEREVRV